MEKYRKEDSYYEDLYDRYTIEILKELEKESKVPLKHERHVNLKTSFVIEEQYNALTPFYNRAVQRAQSRQESIIQAKQRDENKDRLVMYNPMPEIVKCHTCNCRMNFCSHFFKDNDTKILFAFECPKGHSPKKVLYPNGDEYYFKKTVCRVCSSDDIKSTSKKTKKLLTCIDTCNDCGNVVKDVYDLTFKPKAPITDEDRKKYCIDFVGRKTFWQDLEAVVEFAEYHKLVEQEKKIKEEYKVNDLEKINLPQLEERLIKLTEEHKFKKLQFQSPDMGRHVTVEFSIQDASTRTEKESKKLIAKILQEHLVKTNWRLVSPDNIHYRLGIISGKLKAHETEEDLLMLAKQIIDGKKH